MIDELQAFLIFCEDIRTEEGEKPMLIGVLSPVFFTEPNPGVSDDVYLVTFVHVPYAIEEVTLRLELSFSNLGKKDSRSIVGTKLTRPDETQPSDPWAAYLPFPITVEEWRDGSMIGARLKANKVSASAQLTCHMNKQAAPLKKRKRQKSAQAAPA